MERKGEGWCNHRCLMFSYLLLSKVSVFTSCFCILLTACLPCITKAVPLCQRTPQGFVFLLFLLSSVTASWLVGSQYHSQTDDCSNHACFLPVPFLSKHPAPSHNQTLSPVSISCTRQSLPSSPACLCVFLLSPSGLMSCSDITTNSMKAACAATQSLLHSVWSVRHSLKHTSHLFPRTVPNQLLWG